MKDQIVQDVRKIREEIVEECREKGISIMDHLKSVQANFKGLIVRKPSSPRKRKATA